MKKVISATITPLKNDGSLDKAGLKKIFDRNIRHGLDGIFILGSMGEWSSFSTGFKEEFVAEAAEITAGKTDLLVGINATSLPLALENMKTYSQYKFDSYVYMLPGAPFALDPVKTVLTVLDKADRDVYFYYCPPNNNKIFTLDDFAKIMAHPRLKGIKNSSSNMWLRRELLLLKRENGFKTLLLEGQEWAVDEAMIVGMDGMVCGMGALCSKIMVGIARAVDREDYKEAVRLQNVLIEIFHGVYGIKLSNVWNGQKYALMKLGLCESANTVIQEMSGLTPETMARVEKCLEEFKTELD